jgi:hypothetical protein
MDTFEYMEKYRVVKGDLIPIYYVDTTDDSEPDTIIDDISYYKVLFVDYNDTDILIDVGEGNGHDGEYEGEYYSQNGSAWWTHFCDFIDLPPLGTKSFTTIKQMLTGNKK